MRWNSRSGPGVIALAAVVATATLLAGCGSSSVSGNTDGSTGNAGGTVDRSAALRIAYPVTQSLDPRQAPEPAQLTIATWPVYDRLIQVSANSEYTPMLATKWEFSQDGKALTLQLRKGVTFSDGTPFDAAAVKANLEWDQKAKGSALALNVADIAKVDVVGDRTVKLELVKPSTTVLSALASTLGGIMISPKALGNKDLATHPVGTGAYVISSYKPGETITYKRRTDKGGIWDPKTGKPATVSITTMDSDAESAALKSGQIDVTTWASTTDTFQSELSSGSLVNSVMPGVLNMVGMNFNKTMKPFNDPLVRKAVNYAIDRDAIVKAVSNEGQARVQPWPDGLPGFEKSREGTYPYDPAKAKQLLKKAGYAHGVDAGEMLVAQVGQFSTAATAIQANLAAAGIKIKLRNMDVYSLVTAWAKSKANAELMYMSTPSIDPYSWLQRLYVNPVWTPGGGDATITKLIAGTDDPTLSEQQRAAKVGKAVQYATDQAFYAPIWQGGIGHVASAKVRNVNAPASVNGGVADLRNAYLVK